MLSVLYLVESPKLNFLKVSPPHTEVTITPYAEAVARVRKTTILKVSNHDASILDMNASAVWYFVLVEFAKVINVVLFLYG